MKQSIAASLATTVGPRAMRERRHALRVDTGVSLPRRAGNVLLHELVTRMPDVAARLTHTARSAGDLEFVGEGFDAAVVRKPGENVVTKVHYRTAANTDAQRAAEVAERQAAYTTMAAEIGTLAVPQTTQVEPHPKYPSISVVTTRQPFVPHTVAELWTPEGLATPQTVAAVMSETPTAHDGLMTLVEATNRLYDQHGMVPDSGGDNLVIANADSQLLVIDGQPITSQYAPAQTAMMRSIDSLASALDTVRA